MAACPDCKQTRFLFEVKSEKKRTQTVCWSTQCKPAILSDERKQWLGEKKQEFAAYFDKQHQWLSEQGIRECVRRDIETPNWRKSKFTLI